MDTCQDPIQAFTILLLEEPSEVSEALAKLLRSEGYSVLTATDEQAAQHLAEVAHPDIFIIELGHSVPEMLEVGRRLRGRNSSQAPVILIANSMESDAPYVVIGPNEYFTLMDGFDQLQALLRDVAPVTKS